MKSCAYRSANEFFFSFYFWSLYSWVVVTSIVIWFTHSFFFVFLFFFLSFFFFLFFVSDVWSFSVCIRSFGFLLHFHSTKLSFRTERHCQILCDYCIYLTLVRDSVWWNWQELVSLRGVKLHFYKIFFETVICFELLTWGHIYKDLSVRSCAESVHNEEIKNAKNSILKKIALGTCTFSREMAQFPPTLDPNLEAKMQTTRKRVKIFSNKIHSEHSAPDKKPGTISNSQDICDQERAGQQFANQGMNVAEYQNVTLHTRVSARHQWTRFILFGTPWLKAAGEDRRFEEGFVPLWAFAISGCKPRKSADEACFPFFTFFQRTITLNLHQAQDGLREQGRFCNKTIWRRTTARRSTKVV